MKKIGAYTWALIVLVFVFLTAGLFTLGTARTTGESVLLKGGNTAYYTVNVGSNDKLASVYVNLGEVYVAEGEAATVTVKTSSTSSPSTSAGNWSTFGMPFNAAAVRTTAKGEAVHYNWIEFSQSKARTIKKISITASANVRVNEIVCLNEKGEKLNLTAYNPSSSTFTQARMNELAAAFDAQDSFTTSKNAYYTYSLEEGGYMLSVQNVLSGNEILDGSVYHLEKDFNHLATAAMAGSVAIFGASPFALRLPALLSACCILVFAFFLLKELLKSEKTAFIFSVLLAVGGLLVTVGRLGAPYMMVASALVASTYFMYLFFSRGITKDLNGGANVLLSGVFAAIAMAMDATAIIPAIAVLVLFGFGLHRQHVAYQLALSKTEGQGETKVDENGNETIVNKAADKAKALYVEKVRLSIGFAVIGFVILTVMLLLLGTVLCYSAYVRAFDGADKNILLILWDGLIKSARGYAPTYFTSESTASVFAWFLPWKAATLYAVEGEGYLAWSVLPNVIVTLLSLAAFIFMTVKTVQGFVKKQESKEALRQRRTYFVMLGGLVAALLMSLINRDLCVISSSLFHVFYVGFIPLALHAWENNEEGCEKCKKTASVCAWVIVGLAAAVFVLTLPALYGFAVPTAWAKAFAWTSFISNGFFR